MADHGTPCWYELNTSAGKLAELGGFYARIFGWAISDSGMEGFTYHLARSDGDMVAGLMELPADAGCVMPCWMIYFAVTDAAQTVADARAAGATVKRDLAEIPGTGSFAILADPQGAVFGILQPEPMDSPDQGNAFDQKKTGHGNWNELMSADPQAGFDFYAGLMGWSRGDAMDMGEMGTYQLLRHGDADIGAIQPLGDAPVSAWLPYFGVDGSVADKMADVTAAGGQIQLGPQEVPGPAYIAICTDPQGAWFAMVSPEK
ncbi:VOC family protein [Paracoccus fistulariae]|uniref:VOC family protein n=1 Tax=Paracoccus fistulariae TaxID=658446 RepID=A0ABY7SG21_9RHOB|nr:VOC family protein [Paracoccus fistulariae]MDB6181734.1 VOC family protein [Paracoccus fistulariae]WCR05968.1 VOC family protein [Paracoccus fistulariae]